MLACTTDDLVYVIMAIACVRLKAAGVQVQLYILQLLLDNLLGILNMLEVQVHALVQVVDIVIQLLENGQLSVIRNVLLVLDELLALLFVVCYGASVAFLVRLGSLLLVLADLRIQVAEWPPHVGIVVILLVAAVLPPAVDESVRMLRPAERVLITPPNIVERLLQVGRIVALALTLVCFENLLQGLILILHGSLMGMHLRECDLEYFQHEIRVPQRRVRRLNDVLVQQAELRLDATEHKLVLLEADLTE